MGLLRSSAPNSVIEVFNSPRSTRVNSSTIGRIHFRIRDGVFNRLVEIENISGSGVALKKSQLHRVVMSGDVLAGELHLDGKSFLCEAVVRHSTGNSVGCQFLGGNAGLIRERLEEFFVVELLSQKLRFAEERAMDAWPGVWLHALSDGNQNELAYAFDQGRLVYFHIALIGMYLEGRAGEALRFGCLVRNPVREEIKSHLFDAREERPSEIVGLIRLSRQLLSKMTQISPEVKQALLFALGG